MDTTSFSTIVANWPTDWIILGAFAAITALDALRAGSSRAAALSLALPLAALSYGELSHTTPLSSFMNQFSAPIAQMVLFAILLAIFFILMTRIVGLWGDASEGPIQALIAGVACASVVTVVWLQIPTLDALWHFGPHIQTIFGPAYQLWWLLGAFAGLAYVRS